MRPAKREPKDLAASVRQRLLNLARDTGEDYNALLVRFATERLLFRSSRSAHVGRFVLKGAWLFYAWELQRRATRDVDFLGFGESTVEAVEGLFREILATEVEPDGVTFDLDTLRVVSTRDGATYPGVRVRVEAKLGVARVGTQVDVGYGDALVGEPETLELPSLLDFPAPRLRAYSAETAVAEKLEAIVRFGTVTSRFKDFFDLWVIASEQHVNGALLRDQIRETFTRRGTALQADVPTGLADSFAEDPASQTQWSAFVERTRAVREVPGRFQDVVIRIRQLVLPVLGAVAEDRPLTASWKPSSGWVPP